ncbi:MAG: MazG family protein [Clostridia bacterium]|nr:MazG family protein [Clostridia bacterium]
MKRYTMDELIEIISILRKKCPWDSVQTHESLKNCLIEETYEVLEALDSGDGKMMADEMGDLLMQILIHAEIGKEEGEYTLDDVVSALANKMVRRHPSIFPESGNDGKSWDEIKKNEKNLGSEAEILQNISKYLPALQRSMKFSQKMQKWGKEKEDISSYCEEMRAILSKIEQGEKPSEHEFGKFLYSASAVCGEFKGSPEIILNNFLENFAKTLEK